MKNYLGHNSGNVRALNTYQQKQMLVMLKKGSSPFVPFDQAPSPFVPLEQNGIRAFMKDNIAEIALTFASMKRMGKSRISEKQLGGGYSGKRERNSR